MELWIHRMKTEGLRLWLSGTLRIPVSLESLDHLNLKLSICGYSLHRDPERNYIFRVMYSGCFVQLEHGNYVLVLNLLKRISRFGGRTSSFVMKCPMAIVPLSAEHIYCDPNVIQVTRQMPLDSWNNKLQWSLALRGKLVVALEDASLVNLNAEINGSSITVKGRRDVMTLETVLGKSEEFLPLKLVSGHYAYSLETSCPSVSSSPPGETVLHIFKRRMGLTRRGGYETETLSVSDVSVSQTSTFSVSESGDFVQLTIPTSHILQTKNCTGPAGGALRQPFFSLSVVLTFNETPHKVNWSMDNIFPCTESPSPSAAMTQTQEEPSSLLPSPPALGSTPAVHSTVLPPLALTPTNQKLPTETVTRETPSTSALRSPRQALESTTVVTLAPEMLPGVTARNVQGNAQRVTSVNPRILSSPPPAVSQGTATPFPSADLRPPPPQLESGRSTPQPASLGAEVGVRPTPTSPRVAGSVSPRREATGWADSTSDPPQSSAGLRDSLSARPTGSPPQEGGGAFSVNPPDAQRMETVTAEERGPTSLNDSEPAWGSLLVTRGRSQEDGYLAGGQRLTKSSGTRLAFPSSTETEQERADAQPRLSALRRLGAEVILGRPGQRFCKCLAIGRICGRERFRAECYGGGGAEFRHRYRSFHPLNSSNSH
ncbi:hypothetical protein SKAU_G00111060 [Synaphobranchus kaupii]|uniref:CIROZ beta domain-containing protein n=1 Tax=Synaphobranchus kaupii TaxID=118154 RepID=A0A9Q1G0A3_SYNKA|nr:hypothetical protein SKAU_G00111060 [Synaphobranchus kaupii]